MPWNYIVLGTLTVIIIYTFLPTILIRVFGIGGIKRGPKGRREVFLTFDDGPDPVYTPQVLDILRRHGLKAAFFVTGCNAKKHIQVIKRIAAEGHHIGIHGMKHRLAWLMGPKSTLNEIREAAELIYSATGKSPVLYRAPWGVYNCINYFTAVITGHRSILWTFMCWDWTSRCSAESITGFVKRRLKSGAIIVLHDSAGPVCSCQNAPRHMVKALPLIIKEIYRQGYHIGPPDTLQAWAQLSCCKRVTISLWSIWERCFAALAGVKPLAGTVDSAFSLALRKYRGQPLNLPDGTLIKPGDLLGELHFDNNLLLNITSRAPGPEQTATALLRSVKQSLPRVAAVLASDPRYKQVKAVYGITMIHRGARFLGFKIYDIYPAVLRIITTWYQRWLLIVFHPRGLSHFIKHRSKMVPKMLVMSKKQLLQRYCPLDEYTT
ncbi:peptidoglycan/xylan/chitin deacetylase (PgdA/CDA1 family) [Desulfohalotomaculum tongense]|uniref:polysaccharide deacetylase family protein n=1 Tax=Desulforadius tongensis TaxID=1216062 RepID=UPI00195989E7|nr:polysaccharide deacetylase family protein [Desulforadius tongensis]MBM7855919.1 peptidoglycan/xylan/chitin deacetylase (PgdA/CDA1 family) [Desulforadius tongensis]